MWGAISQESCATKNVIAYYANSTVESAEQSAKGIDWSLLHFSSAANEQEGVIGHSAAACGVGRSLLYHSVTTRLLQCVVRLLTAAFPVPGLPTDDPTAAQFVHCAVRFCCEHNVYRYTVNNTCTQRNTLNVQ